MCSCTQTSKTPAGPPGNFNYVFACTDSDGATKEVRVTAGNDDSAKTLAELDCESSRLATYVDRFTTLHEQRLPSDKSEELLTLQCYLQADDDYYYIYPDPCKNIFYRAPKQAVKLYEKTSSVNCSDGSVKGLFTITLDACAVDAKLQYDKGIYTKEIQASTRYSADTLSVKITFRANGEGTISFNGNSYPCLGNPTIKYPTDLTITTADKFPQKYSTEYQVMMYFAILIWGQRGIYIHWGDDTLATNDGPSAGCIHVEKPQIETLYNWITLNTRIQISYPW